MQTQNTQDTELVREMEQSHAIVALSIKQHHSITTHADAMARLERERNYPDISKDITLKPLHYESGTNGSYPDITYRHIAKMMCSHLKVEGTEYSIAVENMLVSIQALPIEAKHALKCAYIFSRKAPREEREDLFQDLMLKLLQARIGDEKLTYAVARCDWMDWWKRYKIRAHLSLDESVSQDESGNPVTLGDLLVNEIRFETMVDGKLDAEYIWSKLPVTIKPIITKRLQSKALTACERQRLNRFVHGQGTSLLLQS
jgi:hypothetical protein